MKPLEWLKKWRDTHLRLADAISSLAVVGAVLGGFALRWPAEDLLNILHGNRAALHGTLAALFGSLLGFVLTAISIILAFIGSPRLDLLRKSKDSDMVFGVFFYATNVLAAGTLWSLVALVLDTDAAPNGYCTALTLTIVALGVTSVYRCIWVLKHLVEIQSMKMDSEQPKSD